MTTETAAAAPEATVAPANVIPGQAPAAPVAAPTPAAPATPPAAEPLAAEEFTYNSTGIPNVDYALSVIGKAGIGLENPAVKAAMEGDFSQLRHTLASKGIAGSDALVEMLEREARAEGEREAAAQAQIGKDVVAMAGSPEHWENVVSWARENAAPEEAETINGLLGDPKTHKIAAAYLLSTYDNALGEKAPQRQATSPDAGVRQPAPATPLNRAQFAAESQKLYNQFGDAYTSTPEYAALGRRLRT